MTTLGRPEYVRCILPQVSPASRLTFCGQAREFGFFMGVDHAIGNVTQGGRILLCPDCVRVVQNALTAGSWATPAGNSPAVGSQEA